ncbi:F-type H+-transporting ATPase subunit gamma [Kineothrix alysoides]|uniref:ATP synthase gamma chain n=1 Tax=Kineothrix alysoides TaxID=1469948 RepID=A0A4R1R6I8_9FIRM|nr:ATP synthase F1 subunit gamma [Kineothrix alysoides]TCL61191.1 F-type H+-transporting ATPase subunit gamma [Kineothrix alysoides]
MASIKEIQVRKKSIQDTMKITNAMYMISSSKLKKAKKNLEATEPYFYTLQNTMSQILRHIPDMKNIYFDQHEEKDPEEKRIGYIVITADKGLVGAYNHNILKLAEEQLQSCAKPVLFVLGEVGRQYFKRKKIDIEEEFQYTVQNPTLGRARKIAENVLEMYREGRLDEVYIIYTKMASFMQAEAETVKLLPLKKSDFYINPLVDMRMEELAMKPDACTVVNHIAADYFVGFVYGALVESFCSEQNSRMMAMEAAVDNAEEMLWELDIMYNRARQAVITQQITEVISGAKAQKKKKLS